MLIIIFTSTSEFPNKAIDKKKLSKMIPEKVHFRTAFPLRPDNSSHKRAERQYNKEN